MSLPSPTKAYAPSRPIRVAVANDYPLVIAGTAQALKAHADQVTVVECASRSPVTSVVDVVLYDLFGHGPGSAAMTTGLSSLSAPRVLVFTWDATPERVAVSLKAGAAGVVSKTCRAEQLVDAVQRVHAGEVVIPNADIFTGEMFGRWPGDECGVTARESEVLALICQGLSNQAVGESMYLSVNTVKSYIRSLYRTIDVTTRSQAAVWGMSNGFRPQTLSCRRK